MVKQEREDIEHMRVEEKIAKRAPALDRFLDFDEVQISLFSFTKKFTNKLKLLP